MAITSNRDQQHELFPDAPVSLMDAAADDWASRTYEWITAKMAAGRTVQVATYLRVVRWTPALVEEFRMLGTEPFKLDLLGDLRMFEGWSRGPGGKARPRYVCLISTVGIQTY